MGPVYGTVDVPVYLNELRPMKDVILYSNKAHQISKLKCFSSHPAVAMAQSIEARC